MPKQVLPINIDPNMLFAPSDGHEYTEQDRWRLFAMQPVASLDFRLFQDPKSKLKPPLFRYAWRIGHDRMEEIVLSQFRDAVQMVDRPPDFNGQDEYGDLVDLPDNADSSLCASMIATVVSVDLMIAIAERIGLPDTFLDQLNFVPMCDSQGTMEWGLEVGTNYTCVIPPEFIEALKKILDTTEEPMWYLDPFEWQWRAAPKRKAVRKYGVPRVVRSSK